jgi:hypothetical protein
MTAFDKADIPGELLFGETGTRNRVSAATWCAEISGPLLGTFAPRQLRHIPTQADAHHELAGCRTAPVGAKKVKYLATARYPWLTGTGDPEQSKGCYV